MASINSQADLLKQISPKLANHTVGAAMLAAADRAWKPKRG